MNLANVSVSDVCMLVVLGYEGHVSISVHGFIYLFFLL